MDKIKLVNIKNPFDYSDREIIDMEIVDENAPISQYLPKFDSEMIIIHNGKVVTEDECKNLVPVKGDYISVRPVVEGGKGGSNILRAILSMALMYFTAGLTSAWFGFSGMGAWNIGAWMVFGALNLIGGMLIDALLPMDSSESEDSQTYGWGSPKSMMGQSNPIAVTFGTVKYAGQLIAAHVTTTGDKQYLNMLFSCGEGELDSITDVRIDGNPIANYDDVTVDTRLGTNDQTVIENFTDTYADKSLNFLLEKDNPAVQQTDGDAGEGLEVLIEFPAGLYHQKDDGNPEDTTVKVNLEYHRRTSEAGVYPEEYDEWKLWDLQNVSNTVSSGSRTSSSSGEYTEFNVSSVSLTDGQDYRIKITASNGFYEIRDFTVPSAGYYTVIPISPHVHLTANTKYSYKISRVVAGTGLSTITESKNSSVKRAYRMDNLPRGKYEVRITKTFESGNTLKYSNRMYWTSLSQIIYDDFAYPRTALVGIKALATDQLSGSMPAITWQQSRANVYVWDSTLPVPAYVQKPANNPAWACYDAIHYCRYVKNINTESSEYVVFGTSHLRIDYDSYKAWADFCTLKDLRFDSVIDTVDDFWKAIRNIENSGRGKIILRGTTFSCIYDGVKSPVQQFTMGNILKDSFQEEFLPMRDRANAVEVTYFDATNNYERAVVFVYDSTYDNVAVTPNVTQFTLYGCTRASQAIREGRYRLNMNKYLVRTIVFDADVDAIACQLGDVINFQHDVPLWGSGGRIVTSDGITVTLDTEVTLEPNTTYQIQVTLPDGGMDSKNIVAVSTTTITKVLTLTTPYYSVPDDYAPYAFGELTIVTKPFRIVGISRSMEFTRRITAVEYIEAVYNDSGDAIDPIQYSSLSSNISGLSASESVDGAHNVFINVSWIPPRYVYGGVVIMVDGIKQAELGATATNYTFYSNVMKTYSIKVTAKNSFGLLQTPVELSYTRVTPELYPMEGFDVVQSGRYLNLSWESMPQTASYEIRRGSTWATAVTELRGVTGLSAQIASPVLGAQRYLIQGYDSRGVIWTTVATKDITVVGYVTDISSITMTENTFLLKDGTALTDIGITFSAPSYSNIGGYDLYYKVGSGAWNYVGRLTDTSAELKSLPNINSSTITTKVHVVDRTSGVLSAGYTSSPLALVGKSAPPTNVSGLAYVQSETDRTLVNLTWNTITDIDFKAVEVQVGGVGWNNGYEYKVLVYGFSYPLILNMDGNVSIYAKSLDWSGNYSSGVAHLDFSATITPNNVSGFTVSQRETDRTKAVFTWSPNSDTDLSYYEIRKDSWDGGTIIATQLKATSFEYALTSEAAQSYFIKAYSVSGKESLEATEYAFSPVLRPSPPATGTAVLDVYDKTAIVLTWDRVGEADISGYEVRYANETLIAFVRESTYRFSISNSGNNTLKVYAVTVGGYASANPLTLYCNAVMEPENVTNFTATQFVNNKGMAHLSWTPVADKDLSHYIIKQGVSYEAGTLVADDIVATYLDVPITSESEYTFWIKAVTLAGKYSVVATSVAETFNLAPTAPTGLDVEQELVDKSIVTVTWTGINDLDLLEYELRVGVTWDDPNVVIIATTKELKATWTPTVSGAYNFMLIAKNIGGYSSTIVSVAQTITLEPADVTTLQALQNGENVLLSWTKVDEPDVVGYEIREGTSFDLGSIVAVVGINLFYQFAVDTEMTRRFAVKAVNRAGKYSVNDARATITIANLLPKNVIVTYDEIALESGTHTNTEFGTSTYTFANLAGQFSDYPTTAFSSLGGLSVLKLANVAGVYSATGSYACAQKDMGEIITANIASTFVSSALMTVGTTAVLQYRLSTDGTSWTQWVNFVPLLATFRYAEFRVNMSTTDTSKTPEVNQFSLRVDVPDFRLRKTATIAVGGTSVSYGHTYLASALPLATAIGSGVYTELISYTLTSATVKVCDSSGTDIGGNIILDVVGY